MYVSFLGMSGALYLGVFEQPASRVFSTTLLEDRLCPIDLVRIMRAQAGRVWAR